ncbi:hypothetical protein GCM10027406_22780 [Leifsonia lichenia]
MVASSESASHHTVSTIASATELSTAATKRLPAINSHVDGPATGAYLTYPGDTEVPPMDVVVVGYEPM